MSVKNEILKAHKQKDNIGSSSETKRNYSLFPEDYDFFEANRSGSLINNVRNRCIPLMPKQVIVAFPGIGKTTFAKMNTGWIDLDYGLFNRSLNHIINPRDLLMYSQEAFAELCLNYIESGWRVLINEPSIIEKLLDNEVHVTIVLPRDFSLILKRIKTRDGEESTFYKLLYRQGLDWIEDWRTRGRMLDIHINYVDSFDDLFFFPVTLNGDDVPFTMIDDFNRVIGDLKWRLDSRNKLPGQEPLSDDDFLRLCDNLDKYHLIKILKEII